MASASASEPTQGSIPARHALEVRTLRIRRAAADVVWLLHVAIVATVMLAGLLPFKILWWLMLALAPIMQLQWWANRNRCVLTTLEHRLREGARATAGAPAAATVAAVAPAPEAPFIGRLLRPFVGELSNRAIDGIATSVLWLGFVVCIARIGLG